MITLWGLSSLRVIEQITFEDDDNGFIIPLVFSSCGQMLVAGCGDSTVGGIFLWNWKAQQQSKVLKHSSMVTAIAISPNGQKVASSDAGRSLKVWSKETKATQSKIEVENIVFSIAWHPKDLFILALVVDKSSIQLCNIASGSPQIIKRIDSPGAVTVPYSGLAFTGNPSILASGDS